MDAIVKENTGKQMITVENVETESPEKNEQDIIITTLRNQLEKALAEKAKGAAEIQTLRDENTRLQSNLVDILHLRKEVKGDQDKMKEKLEQLEVIALQIHRNKKLRKPEMLKK